MSKRLWNAVALGLALAGTLSSGAWAGVAGVTFTWNPNGTSPSLPGSGGSQFTADNITVRDYATADINPSNGNFTEQGVLPFVAFSLGGSPVAPSGFPGSYSFYITFTASGNQGGPLPPAGQTVTGPITSLSYTLYANPNTTVGVTLTGANDAPVISGNGGAFALATGGLYGSSNYVSVTNTGSGLSPTADATASMVGNPAQSGFFVSPTILSLDLLAANFSSTTTVVSATKLSNGDTGLLIDGGGGNITAAVPEPSSIAVFSVGLLGLMWFGVRLGRPS